MTASRLRRDDYALLALITLINVLALPREQYIGDPVAIRAETVNLLRTGTLGVPPEVASRMGRPGDYFYENRASGRWFSKYGVLNTLMYVPPLAAERLVTGSLPWFSARRLGFLNAFNLVLAALSAAYLLATLSLYVQDPALKWTYVLSALYATFWWNYLRAHTSEIYQTLFFIAFYHHLARHLRETTDHQGPEAARRFPRHLLLATVFLAALCLSKLSFLILLPATGVVLLAAEREATRPPGPQRTRPLGARWRPILVGFAIPAACLLALVAAVNEYKFGSPLLTGYEQMVEQRDVLGGSLLAGLRGFAASPQGSVFTHFPLMIFALAGYPAFFRKRPAETTAIVVTSLGLLLLNSRFGNWQGASCYGPRYMLPVLPVASLPFVEVLEWIRHRLRTARGAVAAGVVALVLVRSVLLQQAVNALPFFAFQYARNAVLVNDDDPAAALFFARPIGEVNRDLLAYWRGKAALAVLESGRGRLAPSAYESMRRGIEAQLRSNYLVFDVGPPPPVEGRDPPP